MRVTGDMLVIDFRVRTVRQRGGEIEDRRPAREEVPVLERLRRGTRESAFEIGFLDLADA